MIEAMDIAQAFCGDIEEHLSHPKCVTFHMTPEQVYDKIEEICQRALEASGGHECMEFSETLLWAVVTAIKKNNPRLLQNDNSICRTAKDCSFCYKRQGEQIYKDQIICQQCRQMVQELEGEGPSTPTTQTIIQCYLCHNINDLVAHLDVIYCPECLSMVKQKTKACDDSETSETGEDS